MPLRDHFNPPYLRASWDMVHGGLPMVIATHLNRVLPARYSAGPTVQIGRGFESDVGGFENDPPDNGSWDSLDNGGGLATATATYAPPIPGLTVTADWSSVDDYEVQIYDAEEERELVAAIEIVSPSNKDRPNHRNLFVAKCASLLKRGVSVTIVDFVTNRRANLYGELLDAIEQSDPLLGDPRTPIYLATIRERRPVRKPILESWYRPLAIGQPIPELPIWLNERLAIPLHLEAMYEETLKSLRVV